MQDQLAACEFLVINDRGPHAKSRIIDLSGAATRQIGMVDDGHGKVSIEA